MDTDPQLISRRTFPRLARARRGLAMVTAIFALVIVGVLVAGMYNLASLQARAVKNRTASTRALLLAEAGAAHAVMLARDTLKKKANSAFLRGNDNTPNTADDSLLIGFGMSSGVQIPASGFASPQGRYWVKFRDDDDGDGDLFRDSNMRIIARCTAATPDSSYASIDVVVSGVSQMPGFFTNGNLALGPSNEVYGPCGDVHSNGNLSITGGPQVQGTATATGTASGAGLVTNAVGAANPALANQVPLDVPSLPYSTFCPAQANYVLKANGTIENHNVSPFNLITVAGVTRTATSPAVVWTSTGPGAASIQGVVCVEGNFALSGNAGTPAVPLNMMIVATHSIQVTGTPYLKAATSDSVLIVAGADVRVAGNPAAGATSYEGMIYGGAQCALDGNATVKGNIVCRNETHTTAAMNYATSNVVGGNTTLTYSCGGYFNQPRRILQWVQVVQ